MHEQARHGQKPLVDVWRDVWSDGLQWAKAELRLLKAIASTAQSRVVTAVMLLAGAVVCAIIALMVLSQAAILALTPLLESALIAAVVTAAFFLLLAVIFAWAMTAKFRSIWRDLNPLEDRSDV